VYVIIDGVEKLYFAGFSLLLAFVTLSPALTKPQHSSIQVGRCVPSREFSCPEPEGKIGTSTQPAVMEFLPLMLTSVYCAVGLVWGFARLIFVYMHEETTYQGQLSALG